MTMTRVLIYVSGGVAYYNSDPGVEVVVYDFDCAEEADHWKVPAHFKDLAEPLDIPYEEEVIP